MRNVEHDLATALSLCRVSMDNPLISLQHVGETTLRYHVLLAKEFINCKGTETFAKKPKLAKLLRVTLAAIPFKVEANNSLLFLPLQTYEKKNCRFSVPLQSIIPCII